MAVSSLLYLLLDGVLGNSKILVAVSGRAEFVAFVFWFFVVLSAGVYHVVTTEPAAHSPVLPSCVGAFTVLLAANLVVQWLPTHGNLAGVYVDVFLQFGATLPLACAVMYWCFAMWMNPVNTRGSYEEIFHLNMVNIMIYCCAVPLIWIAVTALYSVYVGAPYAVIDIDSVSSVVLMLVYEAIGCFGAFGVLYYVFEKKQFFDRPEHVRSEDADNSVL